jgi:Uma2 family endonuclease
MATRMKPKWETLDELLDQLGNIPANRIRLQPLAGTATEKDVLAAEGLPRKRLCELVDGVLIEKPMAAKESLLAIEVARQMGNFVHEHDLGAVLGESGMLRLRPGLVRIPDVSFISWEQMPGGVFPDAPIAALVPDLAVEVLSRSNTPAEMDLELRNWFFHGTRLVWIIDPKTQTAESYTSPTDRRKVGKNQALDGGDVLPGFRLSLKELFASLRHKRRAS